jgi:Ca-activated chloride channel family protein
MNWLREITQSEYLYILAFLLFYTGYAIRMYFISKKIKISAPRLILKFILRSVYFSLFIIALLGPSFGDIKREIKAIGKDIYIAIDLSASMDATDINPSRIEKAKYELAKALKNFNSDRIGLIIFSEEAYVQCPLTYDHSAVKLFLETLNTKMLSSGGTDLNAPLSVGYNKLLVSSGINTTMDQAKVLILVTDGEDFSGKDTDNWLKKIKKQGINLFILGVGTEQGGSIPTEMGNKRDKLGNIVVSKLNAQDLKDMTELADGNYYEITSETNDIKTMVNKILKVEGTLKGSRKIESAANKYFYFLFIGLVLVIIDVLISVKTIRI